MLSIGFVQRHHSKFGEKLNSTFFKISLNSKNRIFGKFLAHFPNFWSKKRFFQKFQICHAQLHKSVYYHAKIQGNLLIQFQENIQTDCRTEGRTDPISYDPSGYRRGSNINNYSRPAFKSQRQSTMMVQQKIIASVSMQKISSFHTLILKVE